MAKSLRSKREKRLRAIRREIVEPLYEQKDAAKFAAQEAALAAPKLVVRNTTNITTTTTTSMDVSSSVQPSSLNSSMDHSQGTRSLKPAGGVGKKLRKKLKMGRKKRGGKGKIRRTHV